MFWCKHYTHIYILYMIKYNPPTTTTFKCAYCNFILHDWTWLYSLIVEGYFAPLISNLSHVYENTSVDEITGQY